MNVFLAGGTGAIGVPLIRQLIAAGHQVTASTRSAANASRLVALGATPAIVDALDADALRRAVVAAHPTHVVHELTALPKGGPKSARDLIPTNRLRIDGTRNLIAAAIAAGAQRFVGGSFALMGASASGVPDEVRPAAEAVRSMESQILAANGSGAIQGVVLRYGLFYGPDAASTLDMIAMAKRRMLPAIRGDRSLLPCIHVDDAARATIAALDRAPAGRTFDIVDDEPVSFSEIVRAVAAAAGAPAPIAVPSWLPRLVAPYMARMIAVRLPLSNAAARTEFGWRPEFATIHEGLRQTLRRAA
ncbi:MAG: dehydrogenase [Acidobacteria bacterium]|nr:dehydrogenase [Acidobacteriota bacterium]